MAIETPQAPLTTTRKLLAKISFKESALAVAILVFVAYAAFILVTINFYGNHDLRDFTGIGKIFFLNRTSSSIIKVDPHYNYFVVGYDGQFNYFIALDPVHAPDYIDVPSYRYTRILYPLLARVLALGNPNLVPLTLVLINLIALTVGTWAVAAWCRHKNISPWFALVYAFCVGQFTAFSVDVADILAYALVALAIYVLERWQGRFIAAGVLFGLASLARETTLIFPIIFALLFFYQWFTAKNGKGETRNIVSLVKIALFLGLALVPQAIWQQVLLLWLGHYGLTDSVTLEKIPFAGLLSLRPFSPATLEVIQTAIFPALICIAVVLWTLLHNHAILRHAEFWLLLSNTLFFAVLLPSVSLNSVFSADRIGLGVILTAILFLPNTKNRAWFYVCAGLWLSATLLFALNPNSDLFREHQVFSLSLNFLRF